MKTSSFGGLFLFMYLFFNKKDETFIHCKASLTSEPANL